MIQRVLGAPRGEGSCVTLGKWLPLSEPKFPPPNEKTVAQPTSQNYEEPMK